MQITKHLIKLISICTAFISYSYSTEVLITHEYPSILFHKTYTFDYCINDGNHNFACTQKQLRSNRDFLISIPYSLDSTYVLKLINFKLGDTPCQQPAQINISPGKTTVSIHYEITGACHIEIENPS